MGSFVFPYAIAQQAAGAMDDLAERLRALVNTHDDALTDAHTNFSGDTRERFDRDLYERTRRIVDVRPLPRR